MPEQRKPTMMDVAAKAGVSQTTVSLVLNGIAEARVSEETIARVRQAAQSLGYSHARRVQSEGRQDTRIIGLIVDEIATDPWMALALEGAREKSLSEDYEIVTFVTNGDEKAEAAAMAALSKLNCVGIIYGAIQTRAVTPAGFLLSQPLVLLNCYVSRRTVASVTPGEVVGGRSATQHLVELGHTRIGIILGEEWMDASKERFKGYRQALATADLPYDECLKKVGNWEPSTGYALTFELMKLADPPTAIFCANDLMALGCYEALQELGLSVPEDVSVVGYDDREIAQFLHPALTTVLLPHFEMGGLAVELLLEQIASTSKSAPQLKAECPLIPRQSTSAPQGRQHSPRKQVPKDKRK